MADQGEPGTDDARDRRNGVAVSPPPDPAARGRVAAAFGEHGGELRRFILGVVRDPDRAGDVLQATFSKALERGDSARPETFKGWLFRVALHEALAARRKDRAGGVAFRKLAGRAGAPAHAPPDAALIRVETAEAVRRALGALPEDQRRVVVARVYDDKPFAQIARESGLPLGTVATRMRLALAKLRSALAADDDDERTGGRS